jgi:hypothetical protein
VGSLADVKRQDVRREPLLEAQQRVVRCIAAAAAEVEALKAMLLPPQADLVEHQVVGRERQRVLATGAEMVVKGPSRGEEQPCGDRIKAVLDHEQPRVIGQGAPQIAVVAVGKEVELGGAGTLHRAFIKFAEGGEAIVQRRLVAGEPAPDRFAHAVALRRFVALPEGLLAALEPDLDGLAIELHLSPGRREPFAAQERVEADELADNVLFPAPAFKALPGLGQKIRRRGGRDRPAVAVDRLNVARARRRIDPADPRDRPQKERVEERLAADRCRIGEALHALELVQPVVFRQVIDIVRAGASHRGKPLVTVDRAHDGRTHSFPRGFALACSRVLARSPRVRLTHRDRDERTILGGER